MECKLCSCESEFNELSQWEHERWQLPYRHDAERAAEHSSVNYLREDVKPASGPTFLQDTAAIASDLHSDWKASKEYKNASMYE